MKKFTMFACLALALVFALSSFAGVDRIPSKGQGTVFGAGVNYAKAGGDTINLMAPTNDPTNGPGEPLYDGDFEDANGDPSWNGWTHKDLFAAEGTHWQVSDYNQAGGDNAAWCGEDIPACPGGVDVDGGYGHNYNDIIKFRSSVPNTDQNTTVTWAANIQYDSEDGWDFTYVTVKKNNATDTQLHELSAQGTLALAESITYLPGDYLEDDQIFLQFRFQSDSNTDDVDCQWAGAGGVQVDDISVTIANGAYNMVFTEDFETVTELAIDEFNDDMYKDMWVIGYSESVGDFTGLWTDLKDIDPCRSNSSTQVAFIDDGLVVDGTDGSACNTWCYGPGGWITNPTGGLLGGDNYFDNQAISPPMDWPDDTADGIIFTFTVYRHELLASDSPGIFYYWAVRSADTDLGDTIEGASWDGAPFIYYGGPNYHSNAGQDVTDKMVAGRDVVQVLCEAFDHPGIAGTDGSPAPYFDNVRVKVYPFIGPAVNTREIDLAQSNFPTRGTIDTGDLASHSIRFDAAINISPDEDLRNDPGDSIAVNIIPVREDADFWGVPSLHYTMQQNPLFDDYRTAGLPASDVVPGSPAVGSTGSIAPGVWAFDLPDSGFLFPGDILHYYIRAEDEVLGNAATRQESIMPGDLAGYGDFGDPNGYNPMFVVRGLPSIVPDGEGYKQPKVLFVNDFGDRGGENEWYYAFNNIGMLSGEDYDIYHVQGPSSGVGNGIGGRATYLTLIGEKIAPGQDPELMTGYTDILYTAGDLGKYSISNGDFEDDPSKDVTLFQNWLDFGGNDLFVTGDEVASYLADSAGPSLVLVEDYFGVRVVSNDLGPLIGGQTTPLVRASPGNPVFEGDLQTWIAYGGCLSINTFDAVNPIGTGVKIADFTDAQGNVPTDPYSAATLNIIDEGTATESKVISLPYAFAYLHTDPNGIPNPLPGRAQLLEDVLAYFGVTGNSGSVSAVLPGIAFQTSNYPNPFNPSTTIKYSMPKAGHLSLNVYNVRGQLVKTLVDGNRPAGADQSIVWDGTNNQGSSVSSGVYFYEARTNGEVKVQKMALVK